MTTDINNLIEKIEAKIDIQDVCNYLGFKPGNAENTFYCGIPGHPEKHPSFLAYKGQQTWTCASKCGTGNIYQLVEKVTSKTMKDIVYDLAQLAGVEADIINPESKWASLLKTMRNLTKEHRLYLNNRGLSDEIIKHFGFKSNFDYILIPIKFNNELVAYKARHTTKKNDMFIRFKNDKKIDKLLYPKNSFDKTEQIEIINFVAGEYDLAYFNQKLNSENIKNELCLSSFNGEKNIPNEIIKVIQQFKNLKEIRIFYDNDDAGRIGNIKLASELSSLNIPVYLYYFAREVNDDGYDITDFFNDGFGLSDLEKLKKELFKIDRVQTKGKNNELFEAQRELLNVLLLDNSYYHLFREKGLDLRDFPDPEFQEVFKTFKIYFEKYNKCDFDILRYKVKTDIIISGVNLIQAATFLISHEEILEKLEVLKFNSSIREAQNLKNKIENIILKSKSRQELLKNYSAISNNFLNQNYQQNNRKTEEEILMDYKQSLNDKESNKFISCFIPEITKALGDGIAKGYVTILNAKVTLGKTTFARQWAEYSASNNVKTAMYVTETKHNDIAQMTLSSRNNIDNFAFRRKQFPKEVNPEEMINNSIRPHSKDLIYIESAGMKGSEVNEDIKLLKLRDGVEFVVVDNLHSFQMEKGFINPRVYYSDLMDRFEKTAFTLDIALLVICHLGRTDKNIKSKFSKNQIPTLEDSSETSSIERKANTMLSIYDNKGLFLAILKNRGYDKDVHIPIKHIKNLSKFEYRKEGLF